MSSRRHRCPESVQPESGRNQDIPIRQVHLTDPWFMLVDDSVILVSFCPWCGEKLQVQEKAPGACDCKPPAHDPSNPYFSCPHGVRGPSGPSGPEGEVQIMDTDLCECGYCDGKCVRDGIDARGPCECPCHFEPCKTCGGEGRVRIKVAPKADETPKP